MKKLFLQKQNMWIIIFVVYSVLWLGLCVFLLLPSVQLLVIKLGENFANSIGKSSADERIIKLAKNVPLYGFAFYIFSIFLITLEKLTIKRQDEKNHNWEKMFIASITLLAVAIRIAGFNHITGDYLGQSEWVMHFRTNGHFSGFKTFPGNYNAIYMYFLLILSYLPLSMELYIMKLFSCIFDFVCAFYAVKIIHNMTQNKKISLLAYAIILFSPTLFINSGLWAQCESMYAAFVLMSFYYLQKNKIRNAMLFFGIGLSFKLQAIFSLPFFIFFFVYKKISLKNFIFILIGLIVVSIPAWLFGWPIIRMPLNYIAGTDISDALTHNAPTIFVWGNIPPAIPVIFITTVLFCIGFLVIHKYSVPSNNTLLLLFLFCNFVIPFFLPRMHERYFYIGEIAVLLYSIVNPRRLWISLAVIMPALATYSGYLWRSNPFSLVHLSYVMLLAVIFILKWLIESIFLDQASYGEEETKKFLSS
jgi:Gpi18-like mannosyltransferase